MKAKDLRVLHLPFITGNSAWYLSKYERKVLNRSEVAYFSFLNKEVLYDELNFDIRVVFKNKYMAILNILIFYLWAIFKYDIFHFNAGSSLFIFNNKFIDFLDIKLLKLLNKKVVFTYQGSSGRLKSTFISRISKFDEIYFGVFDNDIDESLKKRRIGLVNSYSDLIYCTNPDLLYNFDKKKSAFRPYTKMDLLKPINKKFNERLKIVHFPTNKRSKGTDFINNALYELIDEGYKIDFLCVNEIDNSKALDIMRDSDILIDQMLVGWYGGVAIEAMNFGVPVVAYINENDLKFIPRKMKEEMPIIKVNFQDFKAVLIDLIEKPFKLNDISKEGYEFLKNWHNPEIIAHEIINDYISLFEVV